MTEPKPCGGAINALTKVTTREDPDGFCRTAIQTEEGKGHSLDILTPQGKLFCRLNITVPKDDAWGTIDVIVNTWYTPKEDEKIGAAKAWFEGEPVLNKCLPQCSLISVDIKRKRG